MHEKVEKERVRANGTFQRWHEVRWKKVKYRKRAKVDDLQREEERWQGG